METKPIAENEFLLQKYPGKGGWTFAEIPGVTPDASRSFGWTKVKGSIDGYSISNCNLAPMGNGKMFLPVKAEIRKKIGKQAGDYVKIILFEDHSVFEIPAELIECLKIDEIAFDKFMALKETHQKEFIRWIYAARREETKAARINTTLNKVIKGELHYDKKSTNGL